MYERFLKRFFDIVFSLLAIILLSPIYIVIAVLVRIFMGSPVFFSQDRIGKNEEIFKLYKFRSMTNARDKLGNLLSEKERLTKFGTLLRSSSLDELPELFLILKGDMSFIGPRPQPKFYLPYYYENERVIHTVRGGLIPPDCLCREVQCSWEKQFEYEIYYANNISLWLDVKIIVCTFIILLKRLTHNYGADDRPMLHIYRADFMAEKNTSDYTSREVAHK